GERTDRRGVGVRRADAEITQAVERHLPLRGVAGVEEAAQTGRDRATVAESEEDRYCGPAQIPVVRAERVEQHRHDRRWRIAAERERERRAPALAERTGRERARERD